MPDFDELVASRKEWIDRVLQPWCRTASLAELKKADAEWTDIAGRADPDATLWTWAWGRFPALVHQGLAGVNEAYELRVTLRDGTTATGYPDARQSGKGRLVLVPSQPGRSGQHGPFSIDDIADVSRT